MPGLYLQRRPASRGTLKGAAGLRDGIEIFPRQDRLAHGEFGNALRGPLGVHRANNHRYWFYDAGSDITSQLAYLKNLKKLSETELTRLSLGMTIPDEFLRKPTTIELPPRSSAPNRKQFSILDLRPETRAQGERELLHPVSVLCAGGP